MNKRIVCFLIIILLLIPVSIVQAAVDTNQSENGIVSILPYDTSDDSSYYLVMVIKDQTQYTYFLKDKITIPLQMGDGKYDIYTLKHIYGNSYYYLEKSTINAKIKENVVFIQSIQQINWDEEMGIIKKTKELVSNAKNDNEKLEIIHNYVVSNMKYDYKKINTLTKDYVPSIEEIAKEGKGICYDYSALFAAMLRSEKIPTKLIMGYQKNSTVYHAWNEVYIEGKWLTVDTTVDQVNGKRSTEIIKDSNLYNSTKEF